MHACIRRFAWAAKQTADTAAEQSGDSLITQWRM